jgi:hypothetical protein
MFILNTLGVRHFNKHVENQNVKELKIKRIRNKRMKNIKINNIDNSFIKRYQYLNALCQLFVFPSNFQFYL